MSSEKTKKVIIALSGGVDSSVAAALLKEGGFNVRGVHIKMWSDPSIPCTTKEDRYDAMRVAAALNIPFETWDFTEEYRATVVDYMIREYSIGRTPNPDVMCNREIKFGVFLKQALNEGADFIATGHYARTSKTAGNTYELMEAVDKNKDQSYFLWTLTQNELSRTMFPIGEYLKPEVRSLARKFNLPTAEKKESQGLCFIGKIDVREFLKTRITENRGKVLTTSGKIVGEHEGLEFYTIGQRHGIGIGGGTAYYVTEKDFSSNTLVVAEGNLNEKLYKTSLQASQINWISGMAPNANAPIEARIRYRQPRQTCRIESINGERLNIIFSTPQRAVAAGQSIVFYLRGCCLGGAVIDS
ncbi:MAG: tRNA 2-thiouridine(34) synthase MnmA [bacterium]|nr:tRNA 2-thiouridine(34) synthase MnmA [bacterium]